MKQLQFKRLFCWFAFLILGFFSCYWTSESLEIWQPILGKTGSWLLAILFYIMASFSFQLILNALNKSYNFYDKFMGRGASLIIGFIGLVLFWMVCSMPTNTHTLLYNAEVRATISKDLATTQGYLQSLKKNNKAINDIDARYESKAQEVAAIFVRMQAEMEDPTNVGIGRRFKLLVAELNNTLSPIDKSATNGRSIQEVNNPGSTPAQWLATYYQYKAQADKILKIYRSACDAEIAKIRQTMNAKELESLLDCCNSASKDIDRMVGVSNNIIAAADKDLENAYAYIGTNARYIDFDTQADSLAYCSPNPQTKVKALRNVPGVWQDYIVTDRYNGHGFIWWVLISILVDIAGFIFFFLANKDH